MKATALCPYCRLIFWASGNTIFMKTLNGLVEQACLTAPRAPTALTMDVSRQLLYWASLNTEMVITVSQVEYSWSGCGNRWVGERRGEWWDLGEWGSGSGEGRVGRREGEERREKKEVRDRMGKSCKVGMREQREGGKEGKREKVAQRGRGREEVVIVTSIWAGSTVS